MIAKIREKLKQDPVFPNESASFLYLIRVTLLLMFVYYLIAGIFVLIAGGGEATTNYLSIIIFVASAFNLLLLYLSYKLRAGTVLYCLLILSAAVSFILTGGFGWRASFHYILYALLFVFWYNPLDGIKAKMVSSVLVGLVICIISLRTPIGITLFDENDIRQRIIIYVNLTYSIMLLSVVAYFYCTQYIEAERKLHLYNKELKKLSETDPLTKLNNRRFAEDELAELEQKYEDDGEAFCIAMADIDHFKNVNDNYGHDAGDYILVRLAGFFRELMKERGFVVRWGGEEFLFAFTDVNGDDAKILLNDLRIEIENTDFVFKGQHIHVTVTFGLEEYDRYSGMQAAIKTADEKLYMGKENGRNQVVF